MIVKDTYGIIDPREPLQVDSQLLKHSKFQNQTTIYILVCHSRSFYASVLLLLL